VLGLFDDDNVPLFAEETYRRYAARLDAKATVQAATSMSDDEMTFHCSTRRAQSAEQHLPQSAERASLQRTLLPLACRTMTMMFHCLGNKWYHEATNGISPAALRGDEQEAAQSEPFAVASAVQAADGSGEETVLFEMDE
jgi:hypothetical protein